MKNIKEANKEKIYLLIFSLIFLIILFYLHSNSFSFDFRIRLPDYLYTQWVFNYDYGFIKRALLGQIYNILNIDPNYKNIRIFSVFIFLILFYSFTSITYIFLNKLFTNSKKIILLSGSILSLSFLAPQFLREISRFDQIGQIIFLLLTILITKKIKDYYIFPLILISIPILTLVHEAMIIFFIPPLLFIYYVQYKKISHIIIASILSSTLILVLLNYGKMSPQQANSIINAFIDYRGFQPYAVNTSLLDLKENALTNFSTFLSTQAYIKIFFTFIYSLPFIYFIKKCTTTKQFLVLLFFSASPLSLILIAFDYLRWIGLFLFNLITVFMCLSIIGKINKTLIIENFLAYKKPIYIYAVLSFLLGPLGVGSIFPGLYDKNHYWEKRELWDHKTLVKLNDPLPNLEINLTINDNSLIPHVHTPERVNIHKHIFKYYEKEAYRGNTNIQNTLGFMHFYGIGTSINYCKAYNFFHKASTQNNPYALNNLSFMYRYGICVTENINIANNLLLRAAKHGNKTSQSIIARSYIHGLNGFPKNQKKGLEILNTLNDSKMIPTKIIFDSIVRENIKP